MLRLTLLAVLAIAISCAAQPAAPRETDGWPAAQQSLDAAIAAMSGLESMRERVSTRTFRNEEPFLAVDADRAYVAPDRRYEKVDGRSPVESVSGETVQIGGRFFKRLGSSNEWQRLAWPEPVRWPGNDFRFNNVREVTWEGPGEVDGRPARVLKLVHEGTAEARNAGWLFQTRLWIDPETSYFLKRESRGQHEEPDPAGAKPLLQRYEGTWQFMSHNASISISEPLAVAATQ